MKPITTLSRRQIVGVASAATTPTPARPGLAQARTKLQTVSTRGKAGLVIQELAQSRGYIAEILTVSDASKAIAALMG